VTDRDTALRDGTLEAQTDNDTKTIVQINRKVLFAAAADTEKMSNISALGHVLGGVKPSVPNLAVRGYRDHQSS
jgi:hypothetical protein